MIERPRAGLSAIPAHDALDADARAAAESGIVQSASTGDREAFDILYHRYASRIFALCLRLSGDRNDAERLTQDAFVRAWERLGTFRGDSAFSSWLHRLAVNVFLEDARRERRRNARVSIVNDPALLERGSTGTEELRLDLERAIAALPSGARTVLVLHDIEGYRHEEIGTMLGIAVGTAKAQLHRARRLLRESLER